MMNTDATGGVVVMVDENIQLHAPPTDQGEEEEEEDVMVDLSCFDTGAGGGGGCYSINAAMEEADHQDLMDNAAAIFCDDLIPPLPDFQCMSSSSSSSSSSSAAAVKPQVVSAASYRSTASSSVSSSSASSWAVLRSDGDQDNQQQHNPAAANNTTSYNNQKQQVALSSSTTASMDRPLMMQQSNSNNYNNRLLDENDQDGGDDDDIGCMDVMETLGYMDLLDVDGTAQQQAAVWDYNDSFHSHQNDDLKEQVHLEGFHCSNQQTENGIEFKDHGVHVSICDQKGDNLDIDDDGLDKSQDLAMVFFEWLKSNKESISAEDLRSIKLRKSTIESAARRLGNGKEGMKKLLQLILEWVQHHQLQRKRSREEAEAAGIMPQLIHSQMYPVVQYPNQPFQNTTVDPDLNLQPDHQMQYVGSANQTHWNMKMGSGSGAGYDPMMAAGVPAAAAGAGIINVDAFGNNNNNGCHHFSNMVDQSGARWPGAPSFCMNYNNTGNATQQQYQYGAATSSQYPYHYYPAVGGNGSNNIMSGNVNEEVLARTGSSATREARKKRMMRQRRFLPHHRHNHHNSSSSSSSNAHHHNNNGHPNQVNMPMVAIGTATSSLGRYNVDDNCAIMGHPRTGSWTYWQNAAPPPPPMAPLVSNVGKSLQTNDVVGHHLPLQQRLIATERRQSSKPEKNMRFLLQKVLKQSDVGSLGRIVLPKKEAEIHLPQLTARDGINIAMEDIGTSQVWNMRYRFWPNNKSRMYLLENTGDFVKSNGLQEGDFIVIYSDIKCGKYMIRGVKVPQQGPKPDARRSCGKALKKNPSPTSNSSPSGNPNK